MLNSVLRSLDEEDTGPFAAPEDLAKEARRWAETYTAWPVPGISLPADKEGVRARSAAGQQQVRWADEEESLDAVAAEKVARAFAANCAKLEMSIAKLTRACHGLPAPRPVKPEEEQPRVQDEQTCFEPYIAE